MQHHINYERNYYIEGNPEVKTEVKTETPKIFSILFWFHVTFSKKTGIASTTTADDLGSASIMYVKARQAWFIY